jgi:hypothetical protein
MGSGAEQFVNHDFSSFHFQNIFDVALMANDTATAVSNG